MNLIIWDSADNPTNIANNEIIYTWDGHIQEKSMFSLFKLIEENDDFYKNKYLDWVDNLGYFSISGKTIIDHFTFKDKFSFWWMTVFVEKSPWRQTVILDAIRLLAIEQLIKKTKPDALVFVGNNGAIQNVVSDLSKRLKIPYEFKDLIKKKSWSIQRRNFYNKIHPFIRGIVSLIFYVKRRWKLKIANGKEFFMDSDIFLCSYFCNFAKENLEKGEFRSRFWGSLQDILISQEIKSNWLQIHIFNNEMPKVESAISKIRLFNSIETGHERHLLLEGYLSWKIIKSVVKRYFFILKKYKELEKIELGFTPKGSAVNFWPLMKRDWRETLLGPNSVNNLFMLELFSESLSKASTQKKGFFLFENQSWEKAFIFFWKKHGHGTLIGVQHSTVRYWDLRYFKSKGAQSKKLSVAIPQCDFLAVNGKSSKEHLLRSGFPPTKLLECEAVRYSLLKETLNKRNNYKGGKRSNKIKILIAGDYSTGSTDRFLRKMEQVFANASINFHFIFKSHPNYVIDKNSFFLKNCQYSQEPLEKIDFDLAIVGSTTSAAVDIYISGLPVIILIDEKEINFSPLRGLEGLFFVNTVSELKEIINNEKFEYISNNVSQGDNFFYFDKSYPKWKKILLEID
jgi:surface carbohydrate biosynthesis protein (TIGR04326 family)